MDIASNVLGGLTNKSTPLISINTIIDIDMAIVKYVILNLRNPKYFNLDKVSDLSYIDLIRDIYHRKYRNPLYYFMINEDDKELLDKCYHELLDENLEELLELAPATDVLPLIQAFIESGDITPTILCYNKTQLKFVENNRDDFGTIPAVLLKDILFNNKKMDSYSQFYIKYFEEEIEHFKNLRKRTFYISTCGVNLNENNDDIANNELIMELIKQDNKINLFDIYRTSVIGRYINE